MFPEHAFGEYDSELVFFEARTIFPENIEPGMQFEGPPPGAKTPAHIKWARAQPRPTWFPLARAQRGVRLSRKPGRPTRLKWPNL